MGGGAQAPVGNRARMIEMALVASWGSRGGSLESTAGWGYPRRSYPFTFSIISKKSKIPK